MSSREVYACGVWRKTKPLYVVSYYFAHCNTMSTQGSRGSNTRQGLLYIRGTRAKRKSRPLRGSWRGNALPPHR